MNDHHENINGPGATHNFIGGADGRSAPRDHSASYPPAAHHNVISQVTDCYCFKYREIDKRLMEQLVHSEMYFPHRAQLNDPFDCNIDIVRALDHAIARGTCKNPELLEQFRKDEAVTQQFSKNVGEMGIGSFSLTNNETLLWSHYANDHRGVALRYDFPMPFLNDEENILGVSAVSYEPNAISDWLTENAHLYRDDHKEFITGLLKKVLISKAPAWRYEQEARIVRPATGLFSLPRETLTHVIFGLQTSPKDEDLIRSLVGKYYDGVKFGRAVRTEDDFGIGTVEI